MIDSEQRVLSGYHAISDIKKRPTFFPKWLKTLTI
jgi:hypothetical protein